MEYKKITLEYMMKYIEENGSAADKKWFKGVALEGGKYNHLRTKNAFCKKFMPEIIPTKKERIPKSELLLKW